MTTTNATVSVQSLVFLPTYFSFLGTIDCARLGYKGWEEEGPMNVDFETVQLLGNPEIGQGHSMTVWSTNQTGIIFIRTEWYDSNAWSDEDIKNDSEYPSGDWVINGMYLAKVGTADGSPACPVSEYADNFLEMIAQ